MACSSCHNYWCLKPPVPVAILPGPSEGEPLRFEKLQKKGGGVEVCCCNSCMHFHDMVRMALLVIRGCRRKFDSYGAVYQDLCGRTLRGHWQKCKVGRTLEEIPWDYVVLQEQSQRAHSPVGSVSGKCEFGRRELDAKDQKTEGSGTVLFMTLGQQGRRSEEKNGRWVRLMEECKQRLRQGDLRICWIVIGLVFGPVGVSMGPGL